MMTEAERTAYVDRLTAKAVSAGCDRVGKVQSRYDIFCPEEEARAFYFFHTMRKDHQGRWLETDVFVPCGYDHAKAEALREDYIVMEALRNGAGLSLDASIAGATSRTKGVGITHWHDRVTARVRAVVDADLPPARLK